MLGGHHRAADDEQVDAGFDHRGVELLGALRGKRARHGDARIADLMQPAGDELGLHRLTVDLLDPLGRDVIGQLGNLVEQRLRIVIPCPQTLQIQHAKSAQPAHRYRRGGAGDRIHRGSDDRYVELIGIHLPRRRHVLRIAGATRGNDGDIIQRVGHAGLLAQTDFNFLRHGFKANAGL